MSEPEAAAAPSDTAAAVSFSMDVWPILEKYALAAHGGKGGVFLESYDDILKYVTPGDPENSMLYKALIGDGMKRMPPDAPLPDEMIQTIYDWIKQGALNN
jgi:Planctomycete cytochrome C.